MKKILIIIILWSLGWNAWAENEGTLRLLNTKFDHPQLKAWADVHPETLSAHLQRGLDVMRLQDPVGESKLAQAADSLGLAHGFMTFDYRISGLLASFTQETAEKLLPEIQQKMGAEFGVSGSQPYALLITWISAKSKQLELFFYVNYEGFSRKSSYTTEQLALYKDLSASVFQSGDDEVNAILNINSLVGTAWSRSASTVMKLYLLLLNAPIPGAFFRVAGRSYGANDTLFLCICDQDTVQIVAYQNANTLFPANTKWKGFKNNHPNNGPIAGFERNKSTDSLGVFIEAYYKDQSGQSFSTTLRVVVFEVDFSSASSAYFFDPNETNAYTTQYKRTRRILNKPKRWLFINSTGQEQAIIKTTPRRNIFGRVRSSAGNINMLSSSLFQLRNPGVGEHQVIYDGLRCDSLELGIFSKPTLTVDANVFIIDYLNDDVQVNQPNPNISLQANAVCITAGQNGTIDSRVIGDDFFDRTRNEILCGPDKKCASSNIVANPVQNHVIQTALDSTRSVFRKAGVNLVVRNGPNPTRMAINFDLDGNGTLDVGEEERIIFRSCPLCTANVAFAQFFFVPSIGLVADAQGNLGHVEGHSTRGTRHMYIDATGVDISRTTVHEFGHGFFLLEHPWDEFPNYNNTQQGVLGGQKIRGQDPDNLMDYQNGWKLRKYQWVHIHP